MLTKFFKLCTVSSRTHRSMTEGVRDGYKATHRLPLYISGSLTVTPNSRTKVTDFEDYRTERMADFEFENGPKTTTESHWLRTPRTVRQRVNGFT